MMYHARPLELTCTMIGLSCGRPHPDSVEQGIVQVDMLHGDRYLNEPRVREYLKPG